MEIDYSLKNEGRQFHLLTLADVRRFITIEIERPEELDNEIHYFTTDKLYEFKSSDIFFDTSKIVAAIKEMDLENLKSLREYLSTIQEFSIIGMHPLSPNDSIEKDISLLLMILEDAEGRIIQLQINKESFLPETPSEI